MNEIAFDSTTGENIDGKVLIEEIVKYAITTGKNQLLMHPTIGCDLNLTRDKNITENNILIMYTMIAQALKIIADHFTLAKIEVVEQSQSGIAFAIFGTDNSRIEVLL